MASHSATRGTTGSAAGGVVHRSRVAWFAPGLRGPNRVRRGQLTGDLIAGITLVAIAVPEQIATARLAGAPPTAGLLTFVVGSLVFALIGTHRIMSVGADSTISPVLAAGAVLVAPLGAAAYPGTLALLSLLVGVILIGVGLARLGWLAQFLSLPAMTGILGGIAVEIVVHQLPAVLGLPGGGDSVPERLAWVWQNLGDTQPVTVALSLGVLAVIALCLRIDRRIPGALLGVAAATAAVALWHLADGANGHPVAVLGAVASGLPPLTVPAFSLHDIATLAGAAATVAVVCIAQTAATEQAAPPPAGAPEPDFDRDLAAIGLGSVAAAMVGGFAANSSPPRTAVIASSGGRSQLTGLVAAAVVFVVAVAAGGVLGTIPQAALGAVLLYVSTHLFRMRELRRIGAFDLIELAIALITMAVLIGFGIEAGVTTAVVLSLADRTRREARPVDAVLAREDGTNHWIPSDIGRPTEPVPGILVYLVYAPLWYAAAQYVQSRVRALVAEASTPVRALVFDANAVADIDYTGARMLDELVRELDQQGIVTAIARASRQVHHDLVHSGLLTDITPDHLYASVEEAVAALTRALDISPTPADRGDTMGR